MKNGPERLQRWSVCSALNAPGSYLPLSNVHCETFILFDLLLGSKQHIVYKDWLHDKFLVTFYPFLSQAPGLFLTTSPPVGFEGAMFSFSALVLHWNVPVTLSQQPPPRVPETLPYCDTHVSLLWSDVAPAGPPGTCQDSVFVGKTFRLVRTSCAVFPSMPCTSQTKR